eukprot:SAG11_NODE_1219_length_5494_cov_4.408526_3_plen_259_part_00
MAWHAGKEAGAWARCAHSHKVRHRGVHLAGAARGLVQHRHRLLVPRCADLRVPAGQPLRASNNPDTIWRFPSVHPLWFSCLAGSLNAPTAAQSTTPFAAAADAEGSEATYVATYNRIKNFARRVRAAEVDAAGRGASMAEADAATERVLREQWAMDEPRHLEGWGGPCSEAAKSLVAQLLHPEPARRLGWRAGPHELQEHAWFAESGFDWGALEERRLSPPWRPVVEEGSGGGAGGHGSEESPGAEPYLANSSWSASF